MLEFRFAGNWIHHRIDQGIHPAIAGKHIVPVHWHEHRTRTLVAGEARARQHPSPRGFEMHQTPIGNPQHCGIARMKLGIGFSEMGRQARRATGTGHGVPLVADAAGVEHQWVVGIRRMNGRAITHRHQAGTRIGGVEAPIGEHAVGAGPRRAYRPAYRIQRFIRRAVHISESGEVEVPRACILKGRQPRVLAKNIPRPGIVEAGAEPHAARHLLDHPPIRLGFPRCVQKGALARDAAFGIGYRAFALTPGRGWQHHMPQGGGIGLAHVRDHHQRTAPQGVLDSVGVRQAHHRIGGHDPQRLDAPLTHRLEQFHGFQARPARDDRALPETLHNRLMLGRFQVQVGGKLVGQAAHFAPAHGIGLAGDGKGTHAGPANAAGEQVAVDDGVDLVGAGGGLIHALRKQGDHPLGACEQTEKRGDVLLGDTTPGSHRRNRWRVVTGSGQRGRIAAGMTFKKGKICPALPRQMRQQTVEEQDVGAGPDGQMQACQIATGGAARIDHHQTEIGSLGLGRLDAPIQNRMTPGQIGADQDQYIRLLQILVAARHRVAAKRALVARDGGGHAQAGIGVDVR